MKKDLRNINGIKKCNEEGTDWVFILVYIKISIHIYLHVTKKHSDKIVINLFFMSDLHNVRLCIGFALFEGIEIAFFEGIELELLEELLFHP